MQEKPQPTTWIVLSFGVCCLLIVVSTSIGYYALQMQARMADECLETEQVRQHFDSALRHFDAMEQLALRQRLTDDPAFGNEMEKRFEEFRGSLEEAGSRMASVENQAYVERMRQTAEMFFKLARECSDLDEIQKHEAKKRLESKNAFQQTLLEMLAATNHNMQKAAVPQDDKNFFPEHFVVRQNEYQEMRVDLESQSRLFCELRLVQNAEDRSLKLKEIEERFVHFEKRLDHLRQQLTTAEAVKRLDEMIAAYREYRQFFDEYVRPLMQREQIQEHMDAVSNEVEQLSAEVRERLAMRSMELAEVSRAASHFMITQLTLVGIFGVTVCCVLCFFTVRKVSGVSSAVSYDPYASHETGDRDMTVIANKLQEVVDLLKR